MRYAKVLFVILSLLNYSKMKKIIVLGFILSLVSIFSCQKDLPSEFALTESAIQNATTDGSASDISSYAIVTERGDSTVQDSSSCHCQNLKPLGLDSLSASIKNYVATNYAGDIIAKAGVATNGNIFVMLKTAKGPVVLVFAADGSFLRQCEKHDGPKGGPDHDGDGHPGHNGPGHGPGGNGHGGHGKLDLTNIDISLLPTVVTAYIASSYPNASVKKAGTDVNGSFFVLLENNGQAFILIFNADGSFNKLIKKK